MTLKDPADDRWNPNGHDQCLDGVCGECKGTGRVECECCECGDEHHSRCGHCDGRGKCEYDGNIATERRATAKREWEAFCSDLAFKPTETGFRSAYAQMFGRDPHADVVKEWLTAVSEMAEAAGLNPDTLLKKVAA